MKTPDFSHPLSALEIEERRQWVIDFCRARDELCIRKGLAPHEYQPKTAEAVSQEKNREQDR